MNMRFVVSIILLSLVSFASHADTNKLQNDVQLVFTGWDSATGASIFEGSSIGDYGAGSVRVLGFIFGQSESEIFITSQWSFVEPPVSQMTGATSGRVQLGNLAFFERGIVLRCFGGLSDLCGCPFQLEGFLTDLGFVEDVTAVYGTATITVPEDGDCLTRSDDDSEDEDEDEDD